MALWSSVFQRYQLYKNSIIFLLFMVEGHNENIFKEEKQIFQYPAGQCIAISSP
jgi:hypothetical protein